jgi:hypothetical protein
LWLVCIDVVDEAEGKPAIPIAVMPASKAMADDRELVPVRSGDARSRSWLVGFSFDGDPCLVRYTLRLVPSTLLATDCP